MNHFSNNLLTNDEIDSSIQNISHSIRKEIENLNETFTAKHNIINEETNKAILNLPIVKKIIWGYEDALRNKNISTVKEECTCCQNKEEANKYLLDLINKQMTVINDLKLDLNRLHVEVMFLKNIQ